MALALFLLGFGLNAAALTRAEQIDMAAGLPVHAVVGLAGVVMMLGIAAALRRHGLGQTRQAEALLGHALDLLPVGAVLWTREGRPAHCNRVIHERFTPEGDPGPLLDSLYAQCVGCAPDELVEFGSDTTGWVSARSVVLGDGRRLCIVRDVTDHRRARADLADTLKANRELTRRYHEQAIKAEAASRAKSAFLAHLSHDIRTPLNHIIGFTEMIRHETFGPLGDRRYHTYLDDIKVSGDKLVKSFADILELAELESGWRPLDSTVLPLRELTGALQKRFAPAARRSGILLKVDQPTEVELIGDRTSLQRMLNNILDNALRFTPRGGRVDVRAWEGEEELVIEISDTGIGIDAVRIGELGFPFALGDAALTREHGGMGLGIAIARSIAELNGGSMAIESTPSLGTTVAFSLPRRRHASETDSDCAAA